MKPNRTRLKVRVAVRFVRSVRLGIKDMFSVNEILDSWFKLHNPIDNDKKNDQAIVSTQLARDWCAYMHPNLIQPDLTPHSVDYMPKPIFLVKT